MTCRTGDAWPKIFLFPIISDINYRRKVSKEPLWSSITMSLDLDLFLTILKHEGGGGSQAQSLEEWVGTTGICLRGPDYREGW